MKNKLLIIFLLSVFFTLGYLIYKNLPPTTESGDSTQGENVTLNNNGSINNSDPRMIKDSKIEDIDKYLDTIEKEISKTGNGNNDQKRLLLARKLGYLITARSLSMEGQSHAEAKNIIRELALNSSSTNDLAKKIAIASVFRMYDQWCYNDRLFSRVVTDIDDQASSAYYTVFKRTNNRQFASMQSYSDFGYRMFLTAGISGDRYFTASLAKLEAMKIRSFYSLMTESERTLSTQRLAAYLDAYSRSQMITYISYESGTLDPLFLHSFAYDIQKTMSGDYNSSSIVDAKYKESKDIVVSYSGGDTVAPKMISILLDLFYLDFYARAYGEEQAGKKAAELSSGIISNITSSKETKDVMAGYFKDGVYGESKWENVKRNFIYLSKYDTELKKYFNSIGIKDEDIEKITPDWQTWNKLDK
jgi:hypothetical protein